MAFKEQLSKVRKRLNITQNELAEKMNVKQYVISSWETGRSEPSIKQLSFLSDLFNVSADYLLGKDIIKEESQIKFNQTIEMIEEDNKDHFIEKVNELCGSLNDDKKEKMLNIIKASLDFSK